MDLGELDRHIAFVAGRRKRFEAVERDLEFVEAGDGSLYFAADFSELFSFLHFGSRSESDLFSRAARPADLQLRLRERRLGVWHLVRSLGDRLFMFHPHGTELWSHIRRPNVEVSRTEKAKEKASLVLDSLDQSHETLLRRLAQDESIGVVDRQELLSLFENRCRKICEEVSNIISSDSLAKHLQERLTELQSDARLVLSERSLMRKLGVKDWTGTVDSDQRSKVFRELERLVPDRSRFNLLADAESLLLLRDANRRLKQRNARVVLVTRDRALRTLSTKLAGESWFGFDQIHKRINSPDDIFLRLLLEGFEVDERRAWIVKTDRLLLRLEANARRLRTSLSNRPPRRASLDTMLETRFASARSLWESHLELRLSKAVARMDWFDPDTIAKLGGDEREGGQDALVQLVALWRFVRSSEYHEISSVRVKQRWSEFLVEAARALFLSLGSERQFYLLVEEADEQRLIRRMDDGLPIIDLRFSQESLNWRQSKMAASDVSAGIGRHLQEILGSVVARGKDAESVLFLAWIAACVDYEGRTDGSLERQLELWRDSDALAETAQNISRAYPFPEASYLRAVVNRMLGICTKGGDLASLRRAWHEIERATESDPNEPRFLREQAEVAIAVRLVGAHGNGDEVEPGTFRLNLFRISQILEHAEVTSRDRGCPVTSRVALLALRAIVDSWRRATSKAAQSLAEAERLVEEISEGDEEHIAREAFSELQVAGHVLRAAEGRRVGDLVAIEEEASRVREASRSRLPVLGRSYLEWLSKEISYWGAPYRDVSE